MSPSAAQGGVNCAAHELDEAELELITRAYVDMSVMYLAPLATFPHQM